MFFILFFILVLFIGICFYFLYSYLSKEIEAIKDILDMNQEELRQEIFRIYGK